MVYAITKISIILEIIKIEKKIILEIRYNY